jgi:hypothetical protein
LFSKEEIAEMIQYEDIVLPNNNALWEQN